MAMLAGSRPATSLSSPSSSPPSLQHPRLLNIADELWFSSSVIHSPSPPCLPSFSFNPPPDTSTLLAQLMFSTVLRHSPAPSSENLHMQQAADYSSQITNVQSSSDDLESNYAFSDEEGASCTDSICEENGDGYDRGGKDLYPRHTECDVAHGKVSTEHANAVEGAYFTSQDCDQTDATSTASEVMGDALSGLYDVGVLLRNQQCRGTEGVKNEEQGQDVLNIKLPKEWHITPETTTHVKGDYKYTKGSTHGEGCRQVDATHTLFYVDKRVLPLPTSCVGKHDKSLTLAHIPCYRQVMHNLSCADQQAEMKKHLKCWAQVVASALHAKGLKKAK